MIDKIICWVVRMILALRYRVRVSGLDKIAARGTRGILFLPNHPGLIEPFIVLSNLVPRFRPRFIADRDQVNRPVVRNLASHFGVEKIPDVAKYGSESRGAVDAALDVTIAGLRRDENWLLYPSGRIYRKYLEDLGGNSAVERILEEVPGARVVLVRTRGVWGSVLSWAYGAQPTVGKALKTALKSLLLSGIFFAPRREVTVELFEPEDLPRHGGREAINRYLEAFYNEDARHNTYVPYTIWEGGGARVVPEPAGRGEGEAIAVPKSVREAVVARLREMTGIKEIKDTAHLGRELGLDSLARVDLALWVEQQFGFPAVDAQGLNTVVDIMDAATGQSVSVAPLEVKRASAAWGESHALTPVAGENIAEAFLAQAAATPGKVIIADQTSGERTYRDIITGVFALKGEIEKIEGEYAGIMLPASVAVNVVYLAAVFAGKIPVMVNWTVGQRNMEHSLGVLGVKGVITSRVVAKKLEQQTGSLAAIEDKFLYLEDIGGRLGTWAKLCAWARARLSWGALRSAKAADTAVVLFTSGSESLPKAVPLSHGNLLANVRDGLAALEFLPGDKIMGLFPPFHSFGVTCNMMLPLAAGIPTAYHPNPTEGAALARLIEEYKATMVLGTPTFLKGIIRSARDGQLASLRLAVTGAEKCPESVYEAYAKKYPDMVLVEGYGVTECSPVVSVNDYHQPRPYTIGKVVKSLEYAIVGSESGRRVEANEKGVLLVRGPSIFAGYLNFEGETPFVEFEGKSWYRTGDIVSEDAEGVLTFRGRLKRFVKIGGEMISLPAIESVLDGLFASEDDKGPVIAVEATEEERPELVLFTTKDAERESVNKEIRAAGLSPLYQISRVVKLDEIPVLGTGKTNYRELHALLTAQGQQ